MRCFPIRYPYIFRVAHLDWKMAGNDTSQKLTFLYKILDDNQATIRFLDTKAAFGIAVLGAVVGRTLQPDQLAALGGHGAFMLVLSITLAVVIFISSVLGFMVIFPTVNPAENVSFPDNLAPRFFISTLSPSRFWRLFSSDRKYVRLKTTHAEYCEALRGSTVEELESIVAAEVLKLSFIRQLKTDRLRAFSKSLILAVV